MSYQTPNKESGHVMGGFAVCLSLGFIAVSFALPLIETHSFTTANVSLAILSIVIFSMCISIALYDDNVLGLFVALCVVIAVIVLTVRYWHGPDIHSVQGTEQILHTDFANKQEEAPR